MSVCKQKSSNLRRIAGDAKKRLTACEYSALGSALAPPKTLSPSQKIIYLKLRDLYEKGEEIDNPVSQLADRKLLEALPHDERQRYIFSLCADYVEMKRELFRRLAAAGIVGAESEKKTFDLGG